MGIFSKKKEIDVDKELDAIYDGKTIDVQAETTSTSPAPVEQKPKSGLNIFPLVTALVVGLVGGFTASQSMQPEPPEKFDIVNSPIGQRLIRIHPEIAPQVLPNFQEACLEGVGEEVNTNITCQLHGEKFLALMTTTKQLVPEDFLQEYSSMIFLTPEEKDLKTRTEEEEPKAKETAQAEPKEAGLN